MRKLIIAILIISGLTIGTSLNSARFDWSLGEPTVIADNNLTSTTSDSYWWSLGEPTVMSSTTIGAVVPPPAAAPVRRRGRIIGD
jgi:hypothetical protein